MKSRKSLQLVIYFVELYIIIKYIYVYMCEIESKEHVIERWQRTFGNVGQKNK